MSSLTHCSQVFLLLPRPLAPSTTNPLQADTQSSTLLRSRCPNHLNLPRLTTSATQLIPRRLHKSSLRLLSFKDTPHIHLTIIRSVLSKLLRSSAFIAQLLSQPKHNYSTCCTSHNSSIGLFHIFTYTKYVTQTAITWVHSTQYYTSLFNISRPLPHLHLHQVCHPDSRTWVHSTQYYTSLFNISRNKCAMEIIITLQLSWNAAIFFMNPTETPHICQNWFWNQLTFCTYYMDFLQNFQSDPSLSTLFIITFSFQCSLHDPSSQ